MTSLSLEVIAVSTTLWRPLHLISRQIQVPEVFQIKKQLIVLVVDYNDSGDGGGKDVTTLGKTNRFRSSMMISLLSCGFCAVPHTKLGFCVWASKKSPEEFTAPKALSPRPRHFLGNFGLIRTSSLRVRQRNF